MNSFTYYTPTKIVFGEGSEGTVGRLLQEQGAHSVLLHYGGKSAERSGLLGRMRKAIGGAGIACCELGGVVPNPRLGLVHEGIALARRHGVDFVLAVGGGSVIDSAKAIAYGLANEGEVWDFYSGARQPTACLPVGCVLTIAAAGSEMSKGSVITNETTGEKRPCDNDLSRPVFAVMDPRLTLTLPPWQTASGCVDIMMHTMERYFNHGDNMDTTDGISEALMRMVMHYAKVLAKEPQNYRARAEVMWAGSLCHNGLTGCGTDGGDFATHNLEHELGGMFDVTHGAGLAALWPAWARYVYKARPDRFYQFAVNVMGVGDNRSEEETILAGIQAVEGFYHSIDMPINLRELGVQPTEAQIEEMAQKCSDSFGTIGSVMALGKKDMEAVFKAAR